MVAEDVVAEQVFGALNGLMARMRTDRERFVTDAATWWGKEVERNRRCEPVQGGGSGGDPGAEWDNGEQKERLRLFHEIEDYNRKYARRDAVIPPAEFGRIEAKVDRLSRMQLAAKRPRPHPSLRAEHARAALKSGQVDLAEKILKDVADELRSSNHPIDKRDLTFVCLDRSRCAVMRGKFDQASRIADTALQNALSISAASEKRAFLMNDGSPHLFCPSSMFAYFALQDCCIQQPGWLTEGSETRGHFVHYWQESATSLNTPTAWHPTIKIQVLSDARWIQRLDSQVAGIAEKLYVRMAGHLPGRIIRTVRVTLWGLLSQRPVKSRLLKNRLARGAAAALVLSLAGSATAGTDPQPVRLDGLTLAAEQLDIPGEMKTSLVQEAAAYVREGGPKSFERILEDVATVFDVVPDSGEESVLLLGSNVGGM